MKKNDLKNSDIAVLRDGEPGLYPAEKAPKKQFLEILVQGFYGNRTGTQIKPENFDAFMLGHIDTTLFHPEKEAVDRTIIRVPNTENLVIVYNKYQEARALTDLQKFIQKLKADNSRYNPTAVIPELGLVLYSRCIACRINEIGEFESLGKGDYQKILPYFAQ